MEATDQIEPETPDDKALKMIEGHVGRLSEHFDSVRILCTKHENGQTKNYTIGAGNWYAQIGQVREWVTIDDERVRDHARGEK